MEKVKQVWFDKSKTGSGTGLVLELEDGTFLQHQSTDPVMPFEPLKEKETPPSESTPN